MQLSRCSLVALKLSKHSWPVDTEEMASAMRSLATADRVPTPIAGHGAESDAPSQVREAPSAMNSDGSGQDRQRVDALIRAVRFIQFIGETGYAIELHCQERRPRSDKHSNFLCSPWTDINETVSALAWVVLLALDPNSAGEVWAACEQAVAALMLSVGEDNMLVFVCCSLPHSL